MTVASEQTVSDDAKFAASFTAGDLVTIVQPLAVHGSLPDGQGSLSTDSRTLTPGQWYLALKGENFDGHRFIEHAIEGGAAGCIVAAVPPQLKRGSAAIVEVADTLAAYHKLACAWRAIVDPFVIAVTGSSGKTTTKEMCAAAVSRVPSHKSKANENNEFGVPKTILSMPPETKVLVLEMAMRGLGQIALLAQTGEPDVGIITGVGTAHVELLGSKENIIKAKCELFEKMAPGTLGIIGDAQEQLVAHARQVFKGELALFRDDDVKETHVSIDETRFSVAGFSTEFSVHAHGIRHVQDAWCAVMAGRAAGLSDEAVAAGLASYRCVEGRGNRINLSNAAVLVDEAYNANPDSVRCAVEAVLDERAFPQKRKYVVLGEMAELGDASESLHIETGRWIKQQNLHMLVTVGAKAAAIADAAAGASFKIDKCADQAEALKLLLTELDNDACVMIKGSHCANLDQLVAQLCEAYKRQ